MIEELSECLPHALNRRQDIAYARLRVYGTYYWVCVDADGIPYILNEDGSVCQSSSPDKL